MLCLLCIMKLALSGGVFLFFLVPHFLIYRIGHSEIESAILSLLKDSLHILHPFNCLWPVLSFSLAASIHRFTPSNCEATNATTTTMLRLLLLYQFWLAEIYICHKFCPTRDEMRCMTYKLHSQGRSCFRFFSILLALHMQDTFALILNFEVSHFACHFLLLSSFLPSFWCCYERNSIHTALWSHFISLVCLAHHLSEFKICLF